MRRDAKGWFEKQPQAGSLLWQTPKQNDLQFKDLEVVWLITLSIVKKKKDLMVTLSQLFMVVNCIVSPEHLSMISTK